MRRDVFHVTRNGSIVDQEGALLYDAEDLKGISRQARRRLAQIHTNDPTADWESARETLEAEGQLKRDVSL